MLENRDATQLRTCVLCASPRLVWQTAFAAHCACCGILINAATDEVDYGHGGGQGIPDAKKMHWRLKNARMRFRLIEPFLDAHELFIDIGCGSGEMLEIAQPFFPHRFGFDTNRTLVAYVHDRLGIEVIESHFQAELIAPGLLRKKKLLSLAHVLEHVGKPLELMQRIVRVMNPGDLLYLEVPMHTGRAFRSEGFNWSLWYHEHVALYSLEALDWIAQQCAMITLHRGTRIFARGSYSTKTKIRLLFESPARFMRACATKGRHSIADMLLADYGCVLFAKP